MASTSAASIARDTRPAGAVTAVRSFRTTITSSDPSSNPRKNKRSHVQVEQVEQTELPTDALATMSLGTQDDDSFAAPADDVGRPSSPVDDPATSTGTASGPSAPGANQEPPNKRTKPETEQASNSPSLKDAYGI